MVKARYEGESKEDRFKRVASARTLRILRDIRLLGNCASSNYSYTDDHVRKIFTAIDAEWKKVKLQFERRKTKKGEFSL